jgi:hypothetical protein
MNDMHQEPSRRALVRMAAATISSLASGSWPRAQTLPSGRPVPRLEALFHMTANLQKPLEVGSTTAGIRRIFAVTGGTFLGPAGRGTIPPGGGDWLIRRSDGVSELDVRITLRTDDDQLIYTRYRGLIDMSPAVAERRSRGESIKADEYYFRTTPVFETASAKYAWLNRVVSVGAGQVGEDQVSYTVYAVR